MSSKERRRLLSKDLPTKAALDEEVGETKPLVETASGDEKKKEEAPPVPFSQLVFRYAEPYDVWLFILGTAAAIANGATMPLVMLVFGNMIQTFVLYQAGQGITDGQLMDDARVRKDDSFSIDWTLTRC